MEKQSSYIRKILFIGIILGIRNICLKIQHPLVADISFGNVSRVFSCLLEDFQFQHLISSFGPTFLKILYFFNDFEI